MENRLGKIESIHFGFGGYDDAQVGLSVTFSFGGCGVGSFKGVWSSSVKVTEYTKWTEEDRSKQIVETFWFIEGLLKAAKKTTLEQLKGVPVEIVLENNSLKSWRILEEVL